AAKSQFAVENEERIALQARLDNLSGEYEAVSIQSGIDRSEYDADRQYLLTVNDKW
ncbi:hypothetical protein FRX31_026640, partial [Thalictrum thalictroides]